MTGNPYKPEPRDFEQKAWLYEKYWGEQLSLTEVAEESEQNISRESIAQEMEKQGIPRRDQRVGLESCPNILAGWRVPADTDRQRAVVETSEGTIDWSQLQD